MPELIDDRPAPILAALDDSAQLARQQAIEQIEARRRRFKISTAASAVGLTLLVPIWAATEYHNAGG